MTDAPVAYISGSVGALRCAAGESATTAALSANFTIQEEAAGQQRWTLKLEATEAVRLEEVYLQLPVEFADWQSIFCNGYQSWTESREFFPNEQPQRLRKAAFPLMKAYGDAVFDFFPRGKGRYPSWSVTYLRRPDSCCFLGSLAEKTGFTVFSWSPADQQLTISKDCHGHHFSGSYLAIDILVAEGEMADIADAYFAALNVSPPKVPAAAGWTSWYYHYTDISEALIRERVADFQRSGAPIDYIQIDDGYQERVGDWLTLKTAFAGGMKALAKDIQTAGYQAGLWLAPFVAERKSQLAKQHPDWLLKDQRGRPVKAGWTPLWSGAFYALDLEHPDVRAYLEEVFETVKGWGYKLLKLDFLYAACLQARPDKTRGQQLYEAMRWLRELAGDMKLLACGVPLGPAFGMVDYCRIGADVHPKWEHQLLAKLRNPERVSTLISLRSTLGRWWMDGRAWRNDPDVYILRSDEHQMTETQLHTLHQVNTALGSLLFTSDPVGAYTDAQKAQYRSGFAGLDEQALDVRPLQKDVYQVDTNLRRLYVNLSSEAVSVPGLDLAPYSTAESLRM